MTLVILELRSTLANHSHSLRSSQCCVCVIFNPGDLENRSMSPKSNNLLLLSQISICASLDTIQLTVNTLENRQKATSRHSTDIRIIHYSTILKELCQFSINIVKVRLFEQNGADVMSTSANDQLIL